MKRQMRIRRWVTVLLAVLLIGGMLPAVPAAAADAAAYTDNPYMIERLNEVLAEYPPGSYFTNNGRPCSCHQQPTCCVTPYGCNCKRMIDGVDLYAWQCFGYARYVFYRCFGFVDYAANESLYVNVGSIAAGEMNRENLRALLEKTKTGAHIRARGRHSMIFLNIDEDGFNVLHGNWDNRCGVYLTHFTWAQFVSKYGGVGIEYIKQPKDYPGEDPVAPPFGEVTPPTIEGDVPGTYRITADVLNIRSGPGTSFERIGQLREGAQVAVTAVKDGWGTIAYGGGTGWISLEFAELLEPALTGIQAEWRGGAAPDCRVGETLDQALLLVTAIYSNGKTAVLNRGYSVEYDFSQPGEQPVRIWYQGREATLTVAVQPATDPTGPTEPTPPEQPILRGDVDGNGAVNTTDARLVLQAAVGKGELTDRAAEAADVDGDGAVNTTDARLILQYAVGKLDGFAPEAPSDATTAPGMSADETTAADGTTDASEMTQPDGETAAETAADTTAAMPSGTDTSAEPLTLGY